jgi:DNA primase
MAANLDEIKLLSIRDVATRLGISILPGNKAMCFGGHDKRTPSLSFETKRNIWNCFGCGKKGDSIGLVMNVLNCDFKKALEWFVTQYGMIVHLKYHAKRHSTTWRRVSQNAAQATSSVSETYPDPDLYRWFIDKCDAVSDSVWLEYLERHGIPLSVANQFGVRQLTSPLRIFRRLVEKWGAKRVFRSGLASGFPGNPKGLIWWSCALIFPFYCNGMVEFVQGRLFTGEPKYLNLKGIPKPLLLRALN